MEVPLENLWAGVPHCKIYGVQFCYCDFSWQIHTYHASKQKYLSKISNNVMGARSTQLLVLLIMRMHNRQILWYCTSISLISFLEILSVFCQCASSSWLLVAQQLMLSPHYSRDLGSILTSDAACLKVACFYAWDSAIYPAFIFFSKTCWKDSGHCDLLLNVEKRLKTQKGVNGQVRRNKI